MINDVTLCTKLGVLDVGANIGVYSLVAAAMGHNVIAVEPFDGNLRRFHKAINLGAYRVEQQPTSVKCDRLGSRFLVR